MRTLTYVGAAGALVALTALAFAVGRYPVSLSDLLSVIFGQPVGANVETVVLQVRGPRVVAALVVGAALAAAGTAYQGMFRNPLVSPDILGVSTGAALGAVLGMLGLNRLPMHYHPLFQSKVFEQVTDDAFFISIESWDPRFDPSSTGQLLESLGARKVELLES